MKNIGHSTKMLKEILEKATEESRKKLSTITLNRAIINEAKVVTYKYNFGSLFKKMML